MPSHYTHILLDIDDTLLDFGGSEHIAMAAACARFEVDYTEELLSAFRHINHDLWSKYERKEVTLTHLRRERFNKLIRCVDPEIVVDDFGSHFISTLVDSPVLVDGALDLVKYLSERYKICLLSNGVREMQVQRIANAGIAPYVSDLIVSEDIGHGKPAPEIYDYAFEKLGIRDKGCTLMLGDSLSSDIAGGQNYGIDTCWYNPGRKTAPDPAPRFEIHHLMEATRLF